MLNGFFNLDKNTTKPQKNMKGESSSLIRANSSENYGFPCLLKFVVSSKHVFGTFSPNLGCFKYVYGAGRMHKVLNACWSPMALK